VPTIKDQLQKMGRKPPRSEENPQTSWKVKNLLKRQADTLKEVQRLKEENEMQQSESHKSKNIP
jgi:hypothetical protein